MEEVIPGLYELVITRTELINRTQAYFHTCPDHEEFRTADLFAPIKGSDGWWKFHGRTDNWVVMSNGLKMDPTETENAVCAHPKVTGALVAGSHRFRLCLLIELKPEAAATQNEEERKAILDELWPTIDKANRAAPRFGQIPKELILFTSSGKPFSRASKGTIQRRLSLADYEREIEELYAQAEDGLLTDGLPRLKSTSVSDLLPFLKGLYAETLEKRDIAADDDIFAKGMDSLLIFVLAARIKAGLRRHGIPEHVIGRVDNALLFNSTTISRLAYKLSTLLSERDNTSSERTNGHVDNADDVRGLLAKYEAKIPSIVKKKRRRGQTIVLTGSRGSLGSYILAAFLARDDVKKVYCLNRSAGAQADQMTSFKAKGLPDLQLDRVAFLQIDLAQPKLGLSEEEYTSLTTEATMIIHNAYPVNFLMPLQAFEPQIQGLVNLLRLAQDSLRDPAALFISSIAAAIPASHGSSSRAVVKESVLDIDEAGSLMQQGYGRSKFICEKLVERYVFSSGGKGAILRIGQVAGPLHGPGVWNPAEWAPSMVLSSKCLGAVPASIGAGAAVDWIPVDVLGRIVSELADDVAKRGAGAAVVYNVVNPKTTSWEDLLPAVKAVVPEVVPPGEWVAKLRASRDAGARNLDQNPGVKLVDFYAQTFLSSGGDRPAVTIEKQNLLWGRKTAGNLGPIKPGNLAKWRKGGGL